MKLQPRDKAPNFVLYDQNNKTHKLDNLKGKTTLIYFYPKDDTPGCTTQACSLRDNLEELKKDNISVIGVSTQDITSHKKFEQKYQLNFPILADTDQKMVEDYGAWGEKSMYGRKYMGTIRSAVLIGPDLKLLAVWPKIAPLKTVSEVKKYLDSKK